MRWFLSRTAALVQPLFHESRCDEGGKLCMIQAWRSLHCGEYNERSAYFHRYMYISVVDSFSVNRYKLTGFITLCNKHGVRLQFQYKYVVGACFIHYFSFSVLYRSKRYTHFIERKFEKKHVSVSFLERSFPANRMIFERHEDNVRMKRVSEFSFIGRVTHQHSLS